MGFWNTIDKLKVNSPSIIDIVSLLDSGMLKENDLKIHMDTLDVLVCNLKESFTSISSVSFLLNNDLINEIIYKGEESYESYIDNPNKFLMQSLS
jgi:hypothetical protein